MNIDSLTLLSNGQTVTGAAASTNSYDTASSQGLATGIGEPMECVIVLGTTTMNSGTITATLYKDDDNAGTNLITIGSVTIPATAVAGDKFIIDIPGNDDTNSNQTAYTSRYIYLNYSVTGSPSSKITAWIGMDDMTQNDHVYPKSGYVVK